MKSRLHTRRMADLEHGHTVHLTVEMLDDTGSALGFGHEVSIPCGRENPAVMDTAMLEWGLRQLAERVSRTLRTSYEAML